MDQNVLILSSFQTGERVIPGEYQFFDMEDRVVEEAKNMAEDKFSAQFIRNHIRPVLENVEHLLEFYPEACANCVKAAVWLQDIVHRETGYTGERHHVESARKAEGFLRDMRVPSKEINKVTEAIRCHRARGVPYPDRIEAKILFSANYMASSEEETLFGRPVRELEAIEGEEEDSIKRRFLLPEAGARYGDSKIDKLRKKYGVDDSEDRKE